MSTDLKLEITTTSSEQSEALGKKLGAALKGGEIIQLASDLGGGKTTFTRGVASGANSEDAVSSPTFTISKQYNCKKFAIVHFDFYRLQEAGIIEHELNEVMEDETTVVILEWADIVSEQLPKNRIIIEIVPLGETIRQFIVTIPKELIYIKGSLV